MTPNTFEPTSGTDGVVVSDITDPDDARLDYFRDLNSIDRRPDLPSGKGLVIAEGVLVVQRMLASPFAPLAFLGTDRRLAELKADLAGCPAPYYRVSAEVMAQAVGFHLNRGVLAAARREPERSLAQVVDGARTVAVLEGVNDHENLGAIFRNAAGLDVDAVVFGSGCADPLYRRAVRVSMGHALLVPYARATNWPADLKTLQQNGFRLLAMTPSPDAASLPEAMAAVRDERVAVLVGAEGPGLSRAVHAGQRSAGAHPDVTRHRLAQCRHRGGAWRSTSGVRLGSARDRRIHARGQRV